jgi:L-arabinonolactonase
MPGGDDGSLGTSRDFADLGEVQGVPDGSAIDTAGGLWNAQWGLGRVMRYAPDGTADLCIEVPTLQPTRPAFGGADLNTLYITSAREGLSDVALQNDSGAGDVYAAQPGYKGLPEPCFSGTPRTLDPVS